MKFDEKLLLLRKGKNYSQEELAEKLNVSRQAVQKWETGGALPETDKLMSIARVFEVTIDFLLDETKSLKKIEEKITDDNFANEPRFEGKKPTAINELKYRARRSVLKNIKQLFWGGVIAITAIGFFIIGLNSGPELRGTAMMFSVIALIVGASFMIYAILDARSYSLEFYHNYAIARTGVFNKAERRTPITKIMGVSIKRSFWGLIFNYGNIYIDFVGKGDHYVIMIKDPNKLKEYIQTIIDSSNYDEVKQVISN